MATNNERAQNMQQEITEIKKDVKKILENQAADRLDNYKSCAHHREELQHDILIQKERVNKIYTVITVALFVFGVIIKLKLI